MARPRNTNVFMILCFSCQIIFQMILFPHMYLVCPCHFLIYIWYLKICFSPICIISLCNCCRQNSKILLKIPHTPSPSIPARSNPWDCKFDGFYSHNYIILHGTIDFKKEIIRTSLILHSSYDHISPLKAQFSLAGSKRGSQKN